MLRFISFGSGSSGNCYLLMSPTDGLLIDIGIGLRSLKKNFKDYGVSVSQVHHVLVTHDHWDHMSSVGSFSNTFHVPVYATQMVHHSISINNRLSLKGKIDGADVRVVEKGKTVQIGDFRVTPFEVPHDSADNVGYLIEAEGVTFGIITDAGCVTDEMKACIQRANYLVIEANHHVEMLKAGNYPAFLKNRILSSFGHLSNTDCGLALAENMSENLRHIWLCHLSNENNDPELARKTVEGVLRDHGIVVGADVKLDVLRRKNPTGIFDLA